MSGVGQTCPVELKFQRSNCSSDLFGPRLNMSDKCLWNLVKGPDTFDGSNLF
jgi:hypothetical protein